VYRFQAPILESARLPGGHHRLVVRAPLIGAAARPGQFLHVWCHDPATIAYPPSAAVLRRPYGISRVWSQEAVEILLRVRGVGGRVLAGRRAGESLDIIGPLGHGFHISESLRVAVIVAGGSGLAPVPFLVETLVARGIRAVLLAGAADDEKIPFAVDRPSGTLTGPLGVQKGGQPGRATLLALEALGAEVTFVSEAVEGLLVSELLESHLGELSGDGAEVMAIGPRAMLKRIVALTDGCLPVQVSLEERMACGLGACRSCVVPVHHQLGRVAGGTRPGDADLVYRTVCRDGPVFRGSEIAWELLEP
jgi:dihydroorotate dehydrogenase electron transfer subunit